MLDQVKPSICLDILQEAAAMRGLCVRRMAAAHNVTASDVLGVLADLSIAGVLICRTTQVAGFVNLALGPKAVQAIFLFALNCDHDGVIPALPNDDAAPGRVAIETPAPADKSAGGF